MPQMAPMMWLFLFFYFIVVFLLFISNFYFTFSPANTTDCGKLNVVHTSLYWQW